MDISEDTSDDADTVDEKHEKDEYPHHHIFWRVDIVIGRQMKPHTEFVKREREADPVDRRQCTPWHAWPHQRYEAG